MMLNIEIPLISLIVPVFNVEKYLKRCLDSLISQSYKNIEIILIDDGSTDESGKICDRYAKEHSNIIKVLHQENQGLSMARNAGLDIAIGEYIGFVDSDDYVEPKMFERLYNNLLESNADISVCSFFEDKVMFAISTSKDLFEIGNLFTPLENPEKILDFYKQITAIPEMIDYFKLDEKTGL